jgi:hypothetical protein
VRVRIQPDSIIYGITEPRFAAQVSFRRLHRDRPQKELNLFELTAGLMAKTGTSAAKIVRRERRDLTILCFLLHDTPNDLGAESAAPNPACLVDRAKQRAGYNAGGGDPSINSSFHPIENRNGSDVAALADKIAYDPMLPSLLYVFNAQGSQFGPAQPTSPQNGQGRIVALSSKARTGCGQQQAVALFGTDPIAHRQS